MSALPLGLDLAGRRVVCVGGGAVTERRVDAFLTAGGLVTVVAPALSAGLRGRLADGELTWVARPYAGPVDLRGAWLVHTATGDPAVDPRVAADAEALRTWCVNATPHGARTASVPARHTLDTPQGPVTLAVHTGDRPRLGRWLRDRLLEMAS